MAAALATCSRPSVGSVITSAGIRYSNIEPDHDFRLGWKPTSRNGRPSAIQWRRGTSPLAIARKLNRRDSEASRS
ncbi:hypothetical protein D9M72_320930 [compost metagenome]